MATKSATAQRTPAGGAAVVLRAITHRYRERRRGEDLLALDGVDLDVGEGEFVALVGPSGCGKTTLLRIVAGLLEQSGGDAHVLGGTAREAARAGALGLVTQEPGLLPWRTVAGNVALTSEVTGRRAVEVDALLDRVGMRPFARYYPHELSGGMRQRVALARALAHRPRLLLMDEPFGALDELSREELREELLRLWEGERASALLVTHAIHEAVLLADRVVVLGPRPGRVVASIAVPWTRPRDPALQETPEFGALVAELRAALRGAS